MSATVFIWNNFGGLAKQITHFIDHKRRTATLWQAKIGKCDRANKLRNIKFIMYQFGRINWLVYERAEQTVYLNVGGCPSVALCLMKGCSIEANELLFETASI